MLTYKRRFVAEVQQSALKDLLFLLDPQRWRELFLPRPADDLDAGAPTGPEDIDDIEKMLEEIDRGGVMVASRLPGADEDGWY